MASKYPSKCKSCGGPLGFNPKTNSLECENCGNSIPLIFSIAKEKDYNEAQVNETEWSNETKTITCNSCGAIEILNHGDIADTCPFCGSTNIVEQGDHCGIAPNGILPFSITKQEAIVFFKNKVKTNIWAPKAFKQSANLTNVKALYTPAFTFDAIASGTYSGRLGKDEEVSRRTFDGEWKTETETRWFNVSGSINNRFNDILIAAGQMISPVMLEQLEPYNTDASIVYDSAFLSGCSANSYKKDIKTSYSQAQQIMKQNLIDLIVKQNDADRVANLDIEVDFSRVKYKYLLLPVYVSSFKYADKNYPICINGTNGKIVGKFPISKRKVWSTVLGVLLGIGAIVSAIILL